MLLKPVSFIKGEGDTQDLVPFGSELVETGLLFFYVERATSPPSNLGCTQELKEMSALFDDLHVTIFFFFLTPEYYFFFRRQIWISGGQGIFTCPKHVIYICHSV